MMAGSEVYFSGGPWLEAFMGSAPKQQKIKTELAMAGKTDLPLSNKARTTST
jgi:hypothetical protein